MTKPKYYSSPEMAFLAIPDNYVLSTSTSAESQTFELETEIYGW